MIQNLIFGIPFLKISFQAYNLFIFVHSLWWTVFIFNFRFSSRNSQSQQKLGKKVTYFTIQFRSKNLTHLTKLNSLDIENNTLLQHSQKPFSLYRFLSKYISVWCRKKHLHCTIFWRPRTVFLKHFECKCLYIYAYLRKKTFVPET